MDFNLENLIKVIDEEINPSLAAHKGFVQPVAINKNRVILSFHAGCAGCPSSEGATLRQIQEYLKEHFNMDDLIAENAETAE
jgi:Fe-S cluster biogenesis protein NfuA